MDSTNFMNPLNNFSWQFNPSGKVSEVFPFLLRNRYSLLPSAVQNWEKNERRRVVEWRRGGGQMSGGERQAGRQRTRTSIGAYRSSLGPSQAERRAHYDV